MRCGFVFLLRLPQQKTANNQGRKGKPPCMCTYLFLFLTEPTRKETREDWYCGIGSRKQRMIEHPFHVMVVVQQPIFRKGVLAILKQIAGCKVLEEQPNTTSEVLALVQKQKPDVALLDTLCDSLDVLELARHIRTSSPKTAVMILSALEGEEWLFQAVKGGAAAYSTRNIAPDRLIEAIQKVCQGEYVLNDEVLSQPRLVNRTLLSFRELSAGVEEGANPLATCPLSAREVEILKHIAKGNTNKRIGFLLAISDQTVKNHITSILRKLEVNDRTAAVVYGIKQRWITWRESPGD